MLKTFCLITVSLGVLNAIDFKCPNDKYGQYADEVQCDKYYECEDGKAAERLCPDGLVFDESIKLKHKCNQAFNADCGDRLELQEAKGNDKCPRKNGYFAHPDEAVCNIFYNCIDGEATEVICSGGLHFDEFSGVCGWPAEVQRKGCASAAPKVDTKNETDGEFQCPNENVRRVDVNGQTIDHPRFPHPEDCQKFYVCLHFTDKRLLHCDAGQVFNIDKGACDQPENVPECKDWYSEEDDNQSKRRK